jgi:hypothetical protein
MVPVLMVIAPVELRPDLEMMILEMTIVIVRGYYRPNLEMPIAIIVI